MSSSRRGTRPPAESTLEAAKALALRVLAFHARSEGQLRARLGRAGAGAHADAVVAWLRSLGYLDDGAYARARARALIARAAPRLVERRLRAAGISPELARSAAEEAAGERAQQHLPGEPAEVVLCREALRARLRGTDAAEVDDRTRARLARFLLARGFSRAAVARVLFDGDDPGP